MPFVCVLSKGTKFHNTINTGNLGAPKINGRLQLELKCANQQAKLYEYCLSAEQNTCCEYLIAKPVKLKPPPKFLHTETTQFIVCITMCGIYTTNSCG